MPGRRGSGERRLEVALAALRRALSPLDAPWMVIGGLAVIAAGVRRMTIDIDAAVRGDAVTLEALLAALRRQEIAPRIPRAAAFARRNLVLLLRHRPTGVDFDVSLAWSPFEHEALAARRRRAFGRVVVPMATPEDLVIFKAIAARPRDLEDAEALLALHPKIDFARVARTVRELAALAEAPEIAASFEAVLTRARKPGGARGPHSPRRKRRS